MMMGTSETFRISRQTAKPSKSGQHDVEEHQIGALRGEGEQRGRSVLGERHAEALPLQADAHDLAQRGVILDDKQ